MKFYLRIKIQRRFHGPGKVFNLIQNPLMWIFKIFCMHAKSLPSCPTLCNAVDCSPLGSSVHGSLQARILRWFAMPSSRGPSPPRDRALVPWVTCTGRRILQHQCCLGSPGIFQRATNCALTVLHVSRLNSAQFPETGPLVIWALDFPNIKRRKK